MKRAIPICISLLLLLGACKHDPIGKGVSLTTVPYAVREGDTLRMDVCLDSASLLAGKRRPVIIFSFGGGWEGGKRSDGHAFLADAARHGYVAVGIDYRLGIRTLKQQGMEIDSANFAAAYGHAIAWGIEDLYDATRCLIDHAEDWMADTARIVVCGSSAGATNSLTAEYLICTGDTLSRRILPDGFNYSAVISVAGGVWLPETDTLVWRRKPCAVLAYHGTADQLVPYGKVLVQNGAFGGFGPAYYMAQLTEMQVPTLLHSYEGGDHIVSAIHNSPSARAEMFAFVERVTERHSAVSVEVKETYFGRPPVFKHVLEALSDLGVK